jgi:acyl-CoA thioesterase FadM
VTTGGVGHSQFGISRSPRRKHRGCLCPRATFQHQWQGVDRRPARTAQVIDGAQDRHPGDDARVPRLLCRGREKIREFASAIKSEDPASLEESAAGELGYDGIVAPLTFLTVFAVLAQKDFFRVVDVGMETMQIVQVDQKFVYHKPVVAGDKLWCRFDIVSVDERFGADIVVTKNTCVNETGELVMEAFTTLMGHEGDDSVKIDFM